MTVNHLGKCSNLHESTRIKRLLAHIGICADNMHMADLIYKDEVFAIVGAAMSVYNELGPGFLEAVYQEALEIELAARNLPFMSRQQLRISYRGHRLQKYYVA